MQWFEDLFVWCVFYWTNHCIEYQAILFIFAFYPLLSQTRSMEPNHSIVGPRVKSFPMKPVGGIWAKCIWVDCTYVLWGLPASGVFGFNVCIVHWLWYDGLPVNEPMSAASWETSQWLGKLLCEVYLRIKRTCNICMVVYLSKWNTNEDFLFKVLKRNRRVAYQGQALDLLASPLPSNIWHRAFSVLILFSQSDGHPH